MQHKHLTPIIPSFVFIIPVTTGSKNLIMKLKLTLLLTLFAGLQSFAQLNVQLRSSVDYPGQTCANICGYADTSGHEYVLVGAQLVTPIVYVTDPDNPVQLRTVPGPATLW